MSKDIFICITHEKKKITEVRAQEMLKKSIRKEENESRWNYGDTQRNEEKHGNCLITQINT